MGFISCNKDFSGYRDLCFWFGTGGGITGAWKEDKKEKEGEGESVNYLFVLVKVFVGVLIFVVIESQFFPHFILPPLYFWNGSN